MKGVDFSQSKKHVYLIVVVIAAFPFEVADVAVFLDMIGFFNHFDNCGIVEVSLGFRSKLKL